MIVDENDSIINNLSRLQWACRRGMLELDVLLGNFLEKAYSSLSSKEKHHFVALLECSDPELFDWLMGHSMPEDPGLAHITEKIRCHAQSRV